MISSTVSDTFTVTMERWQSGRSRILGKDVYGKPYRGFESPSLRKYQNPKHVFRFCCILRESMGFEKLLSYFQASAENSQKVYCSCNERNFLSLRTNAGPCGKLSLFVQPKRKGDCHAVLCCTWIFNSSSSWRALCKR